MQANVGDPLVVHGAHVSDPVREGEIIEVHGENGTAPAVPPSSSWASPWPCWRLLRSS